MSTPQDPFRPPPAGGGGPKGSDPASAGPPGSRPTGGQPTVPAGWGQPGWGQPGWGPPLAGPPAQGEGAPAWTGGRPPFGTAPAAPTRNGLGTAAVVVGLLSLPAAITVIGGALAGLIAVVLGVQARRRVRTAEADNGGAATAGIVLGCLGLAATLVAVAVWVTLLRSDTGQDLVQCLSSAPDQAAVERCQRQFEDELTG
jgi:hypothetical protein